ncbi:hypothetical protein BGZ60DRAFT_501165 [Tricladium varicosporioides]|nr:hypothetical protein BGZ60DRAFT_501165 [Hymenoscyphus varicosporioides]
MVEFTIGEVAGAVNVGLIFLQITLPLLQVLVLVGLLRRKESAVTWSVVSRFVQSTLWPSLLRSDVTAGRREGVKRRVIVMDYLALFTTVLVVIAGVLTPIGLGENVVPGPHVNATFEYAPDPTVFGEETVSRSGYEISRICGAGRLPCPGVNLNDTILAPDNSTVLYENYIPTNITKCFRSGVGKIGDFRSNPFQIQYRKYFTSTSEANMTARFNTTGEAISIEDIVLLDKIDVREGLVIDLVNGGLGFRNHTVPTSPAMKRGASWTEDLLFIEIESACIDTNWSIEFQVQEAPFSWAPYATSADLILLNRGGGVVPQTKPLFPQYDARNQQLNPDLMGRANLAAKIFGYILSNHLNLTISNSTAGERYHPSQNDPFWFELAGFGTGGPSLGFGSFADNSPYNGSAASSVLPEIVSLDPHQFNLSAFNTTTFFEYFACRATNAGDSPNIDLLAIECGYVIAPPQPKHDNREAFDIEKYWTSSIQVCASVPRGILKEVTFLYNDTGKGPSLKDLTVSQIKPKIYSNDDERPIWGVENPGQGWNISTIQLLWGILDGAQYKNSSHLWTVQKEHLYLPASSFDGVINLPYGDSMASSRAPSDLLTDVYRGSRIFRDSLTRQQMRKWQNATASPKTTILIPNLMWTSSAANMLVGTKSLVDAIPSGKYEVKTFRHIITYNYVYAIPGILCLFLWMLWAILSATMLISTRFRSRMSLRALKSLINRLSVGRALVAASEPKMCDINASTKVWIAKAGRVKVDITDDAKEENKLLLNGSKSGSGQNFAQGKIQSVSRVGLRSNTM